MRGHFGGRLRSAIGRRLHRHGYYFYVRGRIPDHKDPVATDHKIIAQYAIKVSKWSRSRRKKGGHASVQYLRYGRFYVILATHGEHPFFAAEAKQVRDFRKSPLYFMGYSIGCQPERGGGRRHASVRPAPACRLWAGILAPNRRAAGQSRHSARSAIIVLDRSNGLA